MKFEAVLFDFDDTLSNTMAARLAALTRTFAEVGIASPTAEGFYVTLGGRDFSRALAALETVLDRPLSLLDRFFDLYWSKDPTSIALFPGVAELLDELLARRLPLGIVTTRERALPVIDGVALGLMSELAGIGIQQRFKAVIGREDVARAKPDPEGIHVAAAQLDVSPDRVLFVGDSLADVLAANAAGATSCWAAWGAVSELAGATPHLVARAPADILGILD